MRKLLITASLVLGLTLLMAGGTLAAVHNFTSDFSGKYTLKDFAEFDNTSFDGWYYIEKDEASATARGSFGDNDALGFEFFQNDQFFANASYISEDGEKDLIALKASYLFDNQVFFGVDFGTKDGDNQFIVSPGYRFDLDQDAYVAVSMDYALNHDLNYDKSGIIDFEVNGRYYTSNSRIYGQLIIPNDDVTISDDIYCKIGGAYQYAQNIVVGGIFTQEDGDSTIEVGATTSFDKFGVEGRVILEDDQNTLDFNGIYTFTDNIKGGLEVAKVEDVDDLYVIAKAKYAIDKQNSAIFTYQFENDSNDDDSIISLRWDIAL
jgi:hypothetical protein